MKKSLWMLGLAVAAMTSCTNDEVLEQNQSTQKAIGFETFVNKGTRAVTETEAPKIENGDISGLEKFQVFGYYSYTDANDVDQVETVFDNQAVTGSIDGNSIVWKYADSEANLKYWTQNPYMFAAYADKNESSKINDVNFAGGILTFTNYTVSDENDLIADVVSADNSSYGVYNNKVSFNFGHMLSKIYFKIQNTDSKYRMRVTSPLTITGVKNQGTATIVENGTIEWAPTQGGTSRSNFVPLVNTTENVTNGVYGVTNGVWTSEEYHVMPQAVSGIKFSITVDFIDNNDQIVRTKTFTNKDFVVSDVDEWDNGLVYCYTISLPTAAKPIEFDVNGVAGWSNYSSSIELNPDDDGTNG